MTLETINVTIAENIATVTLNRPPANAQNAQMRSELIETFDGFNDNDAVKVVVLTGHGKIFSAGADLNERPACAIKKVLTGATIAWCAKPVTRLSNATNL